MIENVNPLPEEKSEINGNSGNSRRILLLLAFFMPVFLYFAAFMVHRIWPFGDSTVMTGDMRFQFIDYLSYLKSIVFGKNDLSYSFSKNLGGSMAGFSAYYYFCPLNAVTLLFPSSLLPIAEEAVILLTVGFSSLSCMCYLMRKYGPARRLLIFSTAYGLMGFSVTYFQLTIYAGTLILFPLVIMGLERIVEDPGKKGLYFGALFLIILGNYYSGFMVCLFSALYFAWLLLLKRTCKKEEIFSFLSASVTAAMLAGFALVPAVLSLRGEKNTLAVGFYRTFSLPQLPAQLLSGSFYGNISAGLPNLFCGAAVLFFFVLFLADTEIPVRERLLSGGLVLFLVINMWINSLNVVWHGLNQPIGFPFRYSYMVSFLLISFACREFMGLTAKEREISRAVKRTAGITLVFLGCFLVYGGCLLFSGHPGIGRRDLLFSGLIFTVMGTALILWMKEKLSLSLFLLLVFLLEAGDLTYNASDVLNYFELASLSEYQDYLETTGKKVAEIRALGEEAGAGFFRMEKLYRRTHNDAMQFDYAGLSHFSSSEKKDKINFMGRLGFRNNGNWSFYGDGNTRFVDCFFGIRYLLSQHNYVTNRYKQVIREKGNNVFENGRALPLLFSCSERVREIDSRVYGGNPFQLQQDLADSLNGKPNSIFIPANVAGPKTENLREEKRDGYLHYEKTDPDKPAFLTWEIEIDQADNLLFYLDAPHTQEAELYYGGDDYGPYFSTYRWNIINTSHHEEGRLFPVQIEVKGESLDLSAWYFCYESRDACNALMDSILENPSGLEKITSSRLRGSVTGTSDRTCAMLTIPYDRGWKILVDGKEALVKPAAGMFLSFDITPGEHEVELSYTPEGKLAGLLVSLAAVFLVLAELIRKKRRGEKQAAKCADPGCFRFEKKD